MDDPNTDTLRKLAPSWTLAGDEQLLSILQNTHQRLLSKCQEANTQLEQMATTLNDANISLQNVNNQFMALSSSQFIESRVYDDDDLAPEVPAVKEPPKPVVPDELTSLKHSISVLEKTHEIITILQDSDTESDTDDEMPARLVMKPKDMYADRPLPYIIGSQAWKNKWHAGLLLEDSDTDSTASKVEHDSDQYSQSEPEDTTDKLRVPDTHTTISETSSELHSEQGSLPKPTPSDVASEIARRLGAREPSKIVEREAEYEEPAKPAVRKIYRPQDPVSSTIFPDEPPPLSDHSDSQESDIFADLHRSQPYARSHLTDDLFGGNENYEKDSDDGDIFSDFATKPVTNPSAKPTSLFDAGPAPHMFDKQRRTDDHRPDHRHDDDKTKNVYNDHQRADDRRVSNADDRLRGAVDAEADRGVKKPVGGISLFGNKGTESIGAAILKRNQRKSSTSGDETDSRSESQSNQQIRNEKDIFDDLFARSEGKKVIKEKVDIVKDIKTEIQKKNEEKVTDKKIEKAKVDLFSDNLFDDIDDIFSTNVVKMPTKDNTLSKSIFEDDDDLFSEIAAPKPMKIEVASSSNNKKSLFDSDDELFSDNVTQSKSDDKPKATPKAIEVIKPEVAEKSKISETPIISKDIFDDDENELFSDVKTQLNEATKAQSNTAVSLEKHNDLSKGNEITSKNISPQKNSSDVFKSPSLFDDDDDDESDLFAEPAKSTKVQNVSAAYTKDFENIPSKNEKKIPEENVDVNPSNSVNYDDFEQNVVKNENVNLNSDSKPIQTNVNKICNASESTKTLEDANISILPVSGNIDSKKPIVNKNVEINAAKIFDHIQNIEQSSSDTNNDYSDQDFDDLPPKEEKSNETLIINSNTDTEATHKEIPINIHNIFDKTTLEEDIDKIFAKPEQNTDNTETTDFTETIPKDSKKTEQDNKTEQFATKKLETDIFSDILTEPPVFEKPKEPKRSKNVNALFDDDSDDESLFFKKNDPIFEENPENFTPTQDRLFGLFTDEPPDDGFSKTSDDLDDMFCTLPKPKIPQNEHLPPIPDAVHFEERIPDFEIPDIEKVDPDEDIFNDLPKTEPKPTLEILPESNLNTEKSLTTDIDDKSLHEQQKIRTILSDDEQLFRIPTSKRKPTLQDKPSPDILSDDENLFTPVSKFEKSTIAKQEILVPDNTNLDSISKSSDDELFTSLAKTEITSLPENKIFKQDTRSDEDLFKIPKSKPDLISKPAEIPTEPEKSEPKKVGKIKAGLNINVNALLPGASPKKVKPNDQTDGHKQIVAENKELEPKIYPESQKSEPKTSESQNTDSKLLKSVSFDENPESDVLDNKLSKERAKIQVKRRPSTRRARREAVRKSGIDFGEDSTDNSSSIDDPPRIPTGKQPDITKNANIEDTREPNKVRQNIQPESIDKSEVQANQNDTIIQADIQPKTVEERASSQPENVDRPADIMDKPSYSRDVRSKVVYILNDEDIFNTNSAGKHSMNKNLTSQKSENLDSNTGVTTLGKVYDKTVTKNDNSTKNDPKASLFGDENDEEIFNAKTAVKKSNIFDLDSEEELFGTSKKEDRREVEKIEVKKEIKREVVKGSLFGDDDDDSDLFGVKTTKIVGAPSLAFYSTTEQKLQPSRSTAKETPKPAEPVFEDPLSMFGDDD